MRPELSVIVPCYNAEKYIKKNLDSLLASVEKDIEIIVVDNSENNRSWDILKRYSDPRVKIFKMPNLGVSAARNRGIQEATGRYCHFCDADDYVHPEIYSKTLPTIKLHKLKCLMFNVLSFNPDNFKKRNYNYYKREKEFYYKIFNVFDDSKKQIKSYPEVWDKIFDLDYIKSIGIRFVEGMIYEDLVFNWEFFCNSPETMFIGDYLYYHQYGHEGSIMSKTEIGTQAKFEDSLRVYDEVYKLLKRKDTILEYAEYLKNLREYSLITYSRWKDNYLYKNHKTLFWEIIKTFSEFYWKMTR